MRKQSILFTSLTALFAVSVFFTGCKPSTQGQIQQWENNKKDLAEAVTTYPVFKVVLEKKMADAQKLWDEALKITKDEPKAIKMKEANEFLNSLLNQFTQIKYKKKGIEEAISKLNAKRLTKTNDDIRKKAVAEARASLDKIAKDLSPAEVKSEEDAKKITQDVISELISAKGKIDRAIKSTEPKKVKK